MDTIGQIDAEQNGNFVWNANVGKYVLKKDQADQIEQLNSTIASLDAIIYEQSKEIDKLTSENNHANERIDNLCEALKNLIDTKEGR